MRSVAMLCALATAGGCVPALAGAGAGGGLGYAIADDDDKALGVGLGAGAGLLIGSLVWMLACFEAPFGPYSMGRDPTAQKKTPWYCGGL